MFDVTESVELKGPSEILSGDGDGMVASTHAETLARALLEGQTAPI